MFTHMIEIILKDGSYVRALAKILETNLIRKNLSSSKSVFKLIRKLKIKPIWFVT